MLTNNVERLDVGECQYTFLLNERGGVIDDLIVYRLGERAVPARRECGEDRRGFRVDAGAPRRRVSTFENASDALRRLGRAGAEVGAALRRVFRRQILAAGAQ